MYTIDEAKNLLTQAGVFFDCVEEDDPIFKQMINLNDVWGWACADGEVVSEEDLPELAELFFRYGYCGVLWWVSKKRNNCRSEFEDINRFLDFVANEEAIRADRQGRREGEGESVKNQEAGYCAICGDWVTVGEGLFDQGLVKHHPGRCRQRQKREPRKRLILSVMDQVDADLDDLDVP